MRSHQHLSQSPASFQIDKNLFRPFVMSQRTLIPNRSCMCPLTLFFIPF
jgi:hypothetical protein